MTSPKLQCVLIVLLTGGCAWLPANMQHTRFVPSKLPGSITCVELVEHLNRQCHGLHAWRCMETTVRVKVPNFPSVSLGGNLACEAPSRFRLTAEGMASSTDLGANDERCWFYARPGLEQILTWVHEDADLMQQMSVEIPRIDPAWLMEVLGVMPLKADDFDLTPGPASGRELWLTSVRDDGRGGTTRRVIKVDSVSGMIREHVVYDHERMPVVRATLNNQKSCDGFLLPHQVSLDFPRLHMAMKLTFRKIETNCQLDASLWEVPRMGKVPLVDVGSQIRARFGNRAGQAVTGAGRRAVETDAFTDSPPGNAFGENDSFADSAAGDASGLTPSDPASLSAADIRHETRIDETSEQSDRLSVQPAGYEPSSEPDWDLPARNPSSRYSPMTLGERFRGFFRRR